MLGQRQLPAVFIILFLLIAVPFDHNLTVKAEPPLQENGDAVVGSAVQIAGPKVEVEQAAAAADEFAFLPMIIGRSEDINRVLTEVQQVVELVNNERAQVGCSPLNVSAQLTAAAQGHSEDMALNDYVKHNSEDGRTPWDRIKATGYDFSTAGENIAAGYETPEAVMAGWMSSDGHRSNILNCEFEDIGVGYYYLANDTGDYNYHYYWVQDFGAQ